MDHSPHLIQIDDPQDPRVNYYTKLSDAALRRRRDAQYGLFMAESSPVVRRALEAGHTPHSFFFSHRYVDSMADVLQQYPQVPAFTGRDETLAAITGFSLHRGALSAMYRPPKQDLKQVLTTARRIAVVEDIGDNTNLGAIFRSAAGMGIDAVLISPQSADPLYRRSIRVSMGAVFRVPWVRLEQWPQDLQLLSHQGFTLLALEITEDAVNLDHPSLTEFSKLAIILGTEGNGVSSETVAVCDLVAKIPMESGIDSLNVSAAASIAFWQLRSRRV